MPLELEMSWRIEDMGAGAILGEEVDARLVRRVSLASNVYRAFCSRRDYRDGDGSANWAEWSSRYPEASNLLAWAVNNE